MIFPKFPYRPSIFSIALKSAALVEFFFSPTFYYCDPSLIKSAQVHLVEN